MALLNVLTNMPFGKSEILDNFEAFWDLNYDFAISGQNSITNATARQAPSGVYLLSRELWSTKSDIIREGGL